jgi:hypothetical protein
MAKNIRILSAGDVRKLLKVTYQYIDKLTQEGRLSFQQTSAGKIFLEEDVLMFKRERDMKAKTDRRMKRKVKKK